MTAWFLTDEERAGLVASVQAGPRVLGELGLWEMLAVDPGHLTAELVSIDGDQAIGAVQWGLNSLLERGKGTVVAGADGDGLMIAEPERFGLALRCGAGMTITIRAPEGCAVTMVNAYRHPGITLVERHGQEKVEFVATASDQDAGVVVDSLFDGSFFAADAPSRGDGWNGPYVIESFLFSDTKAFLGLAIVERGPSGPTLSVQDLDGESPPASARIGRDDLVAYLTVSEFETQFVLQI